MLVQENKYKLKNKVMEKLFLLMVLFTLSMSIKAQDNFFEQKRAEYKYATPEEKAKIDSLFIDFEEKLRVKQVKSICGIEFGSTYEVAERISQNKFGLPEAVSDRTKISYKNIIVDIIIEEYEN